MLLQSGQLLSELGSQSTAIAYPLLVLAVTGSAAKAGAVSFARLLPGALLALPAGLAADRLDRKRLMIAADAIRVLAIGSLAAAVLAGHVAVWAIATVAFVEGAGTAIFRPAQAGALRAIVLQAQLPAAVSARTGRQAAVGVGGPPLGGALFTLTRALPFVVDAISYACSTLSLLLMRTPFQQRREVDLDTLRTRLSGGFRYLWNQPFLRACALIFSLGNFVGPGLIFAIVVLGTRQGLGGGAVGALVGAFSAAVLVGSFASPLFRRRLSPRAILLLELWASVCWLPAVVWPNVYVLAFGLLPVALVIPSTDSVVHGYRIAMTPDSLLGRVESAWSTIALPIAPLGPLVAGLLLGTVSARATIAVFAGFSLALALWGTRSASIRAAPSFDAVDWGNRAVPPTHT